MRIIFTLLLLILIKISHSQVLYFDCVDNQEVNQTVDSLKNLKAKTIFVVKTDLLKICNLSRDSVLTIIIWPDISNIYFLKVISSNKIYVPIKATLNPSLFLNSYLAKIFVKSGDNRAKYVPPTTNDNSVFCISDKINGYFEQADKLNKYPTTYISGNLRKEGKRKEWFDLIIKSLNELNWKLEPSRDYDRYIDMNR